MASVSVVVPVFRCRDQVAATLESVARQRHRPLETLLVDDRGGDDSIEVAIAAAVDLGLPHRVVTMPRNEGVAAARNAGAVASRGELIWFLDSDDIAAPELVGALHEALVGHDAGFAVCRTTKFTATRIWTDEPDTGDGVRQGSRVALDILEGTIRGYACNKLVRRDLALAHPFPVGLAYEDLGTVLSWALHTPRVALVSRPLYRYRIHPSSLSAGFGEHSTDLLAQCDAVEETVSRSGLDCPDSLLRYRYREVVLPLANVALRAEHAGHRTALTRSALERARRMISWGDLLRLTRARPRLAAPAAVLWLSPRLYSAALRWR